MIDFSLTDEQLKLLEMTREFSAKEIRPVAIQYDQELTYPEDIMKKAYDLGLMYTTIPSEYGGTGMDHVTHYIINEALNYDCCGIGQMVGISHLACGAILIGATDDQKKRLLGKMTESHKTGCFCLTEPGAGSDAAGLKTVAVKKGDKYVINGSKCFISNGANADLLTIFASTDPSMGTRGITCFGVSRDTPGISVGRTEDKMGQRALNVVELFFEDVEVPEENRIGEEGQGFKLAMMALDGGRINIAVVCVAIAQKALDEATAWAKEREQFGEPIGNFQGVHFMLADMAALVMASRNMYLQTAWMEENKIRCSTEAALTKCFASDAAMKVTTDAVQVLAGSGYMKGSIVEKLMRDAKLTQIYEGTNQINRMVSGRGVLRQMPQLF